MPEAPYKPKIVTTKAKAMANYGFTWDLKNLTINGGAAGSNSWPPG
jgi:hypothetical protein